MSLGTGCSSGISSEALPALSQLAWEMDDQLSSAQLPSEKQTNNGVKSDPLHLFSGAKDSLDILILFLF